MWSKELAICARRYADATLSVVDPSGYPFSARCRVAFDEQREVITFTSLLAMALVWRGPACLLFHRHDERLENHYQLLIRGQLVQEGQSVVFRPTVFVTA